MTTEGGANIELYGADGNLRTLEEIECDVINLAVCLYGGSMAEAARRLHIGRSTLYRKMERNYDLARRGSGAAHHGETPPRKPPAGQTQLVT